MKVVCLFLLFLLAAATANPKGKNNPKHDNSIKRSLGPQVLYVKIKTPGSDLIPDVGYYNSLELQEGRFIAESIRNAIEGFRDVIINGSEDIPVLDPFQVDHLGPFVYTTIGVRAEGNIRNLKVEGLKWFLVDRVSFNPLRLSFGLQITVPWIITTGSFDARASVGLINHSSGGNFRVFLNRLVVSVDARLGASILGGNLFLRELDIKIDIHDTVIEFNGLFGSNLINNVLNSVVQSITQEVIQSQLENVSKTLSDQLFDVINEFLKDFTLADITA